MYGCIQQSTSSTQQTSYHCIVLEMNSNEKALADPESGESLNYQDQHLTTTPQLPANSNQSSSVDPNGFQESTTSEAGITSEISSQTRPSVTVESPNIDNHGTSNAAQEESNTAITNEQSSDPNTSSLFPPPSSQQYATPLKTLPSLKDIEPITTPKSFSVARDAPAAQDSSPVVHENAILDNLAEANEDTFDGAADDTFAESSQKRQGTADSKDAADVDMAASFLEVEPEVLISLGSDFVSKSAQRARQYQGALSELSFFKLNQELMSQVHQKKLEVLQKKIEKLHASQASLSAENESLAAETLKKEADLSSLRKENAVLADKLYKLEATVNDNNTRHASVLANKDQEIFHLNDTITKISKSNVDLGQRLSELTKELNEVSNEKFKLKLDLSKFTNELAYTKNQKEWYEQELKAVQDRLTELIKKHETEYLKNSNVISSLTSEKENLLSLKDSSQSQVRDLQAKYEKQSVRVFDLESKLELQKVKFSRDAATKDETIELLNLQMSERDDRISQLETYAEDLKSSMSESINNLQNELSEKDEKLIAVEEKLRRTEDALDSELHKETELPKPAQSAELIMQTNPLGISLSALYTEFNHLKKELVLEKSQKEKLASQLQHFIAELELKKPAIANYKNQIQFYEQSMSDLLGKMESVRVDKVESEKEINRLRIRLTTYETELQSLKQLSKDLGRQLCFYLIHSKIREGNEDPLTSSEKKIIDQILSKSGNKDSSPETDTDNLITERLLGFASIVELQKKNEELLMAVRLFGKQLEEKEHESNGLESAAVEEAREAILTLQGELESVSIKLDATTKERDLLKGIGQRVSGSVPGSIEVKLLADANEDLKKRVASSEASLKELQKQSSEKIRSLSDKLSESNNSREELQLKLASFKHSVELAEGRLENTKKLLSNSNAEVEHFKKESTFWKEQASKQEDLLVKKNNELRDVEKKLILANASSKNLVVEKDALKHAQLSLRDEIEHLKKDKEHLNTFVLNLQSLLREREASSSDLSNKLTQSVENYQQLQAKISEKEERIQILSSQSEMALKAQNSKLEQVNELSRTLLDTKAKLAEKQSVIESLKKQISTQPLSTSRSVRPVESSFTEPESNRNMLNTEYEDLRNDLRMAEGQVNEFSNIAKAAEEALMAATESYDKYKVECDEKMKLLEKEKELLSEQVTNQATTIEGLQKNLLEAEDKFISETQELRSKVHEYSLKAGSYDDLQRDFEKKLSIIKSDLESQVKINDDLQKNYQTKLTECDYLRVEVASEKQRCDDLKSQFDLIQGELITNQEKLRVNEEALSELKANRNEELEALNIRLKDLQYQYDLALNQLELKSSNKDLETSENNEDLREVVGFLRREKEAAEVRAITLADEQKQLKTRIEHLDSELNASRSQILRLESAKIQLEDTSKDHSRLMEQLEQLNILRESNTTLRNENKSHIEIISQLKDELAQAKASPVSSSSSGTENAVKEQERRLLAEENARLKNQLNNNEELKNLMQRFENLKNEFKTKLQGHRTKNKELEKQLADSRASLEATQKELNVVKEQNLDSETVATLKEQLNKLENMLADKDQKFKEEVTRLKTTFEDEKSALQRKLVAEYEEKLNNVSSQSSGDSSKELREKIEKEMQSKSDEAIEKLKQEFEKEMDSKVQQEVQAKLAQANTSGAEGEKVRKQLTLQYEDKIKTLNAEFEKKLTEQKASVTKEVDKKYEFKLRVLNRKVEKLEKEQQKGESSMPAETTGTVRAPLGPQFTESTLSVIRPGPNGAGNKTGETKAEPQGKPKNQDAHNNGNKKRPNPGEKGPNQKRAKE